MPHPLTYWENKLGRPPFRYIVWPCCSTCLPPFLLFHTINLFRMFLTNSQQRGSKYVQTLPSAHLCTRIKHTCTDTYTFTYIHANTHTYTRTRKCTQIRTYPLVYCSGSPPLGNSPLVVDYHHGLMHGGGSLYAQSLSPMQMGTPPIHHMHAHMHAHQARLATAAIATTHKWGILYWTQDL